MRRVEVSLIVIAISLLIVGVVSATIVRHVIQVIPLLAVAVLANRRSRLAPPAAVGVSALWLVIMVLIWLYLAGVSRIASGDYSMTEIGLTFVMALAALYGSAAGIAHRPRLSRGRWFATFLIALAIQYAALAISFTRALAND